MDSGCHKLSENIGFVWSKRLYSGQKVGCHAYGQRTTECEDRARILESEFAVKIKLDFVTNKIEIRTQSSGHICKRRSEIESQHFSGCYWQSMGNCTQKISTKFAKVHRV